MQINNLSFYYNKNAQILNDISIEIKEGKITTFMGANGSGKSTLLKLLTKNLNAQAGEIFIDKMEIKKIPLKKFAKKVAIVHQKNTAPDDLTVRRLVAYGRIPYTNILNSGTNECEEKINWAMKATGVFELSERRIGSLSGGQKQRAFIAMALAQDTKILFLDEPTTFLDVRYQIEVLRLVKKLNQDYGITIVMVLHDINQAICYSDEIFGLKNGNICVKGDPNQVINSKVIKEIYDIDLEVFEKDGKVCVMSI